MAPEVLSGDNLMLVSRTRKHAKEVHGTFIAIEKLLSDVAGRAYEMMMSSK